MLQTGIYILYDYIYIYYDIIIILILIQKIYSFLIIMGKIL